jgi:hypothetical protein
MSRLDVSRLFVRTALQRLVGIRRPDISKLYEDIRKAGEMGTEAALQKIDAECRDCGHVYTHHNRLGEDGFIFRRPCGEEDCQCDDFAFTISMAEDEYEELMTVSEKSDHLPTCTCGHIVHKHSLRTADNQTKCQAQGCPCTSFDLQGSPMIVVNGKSYTREQLAEELNSKAKEWQLPKTSEQINLIPKDIYDETLKAAGIGSDDGVISLEQAQEWLNMFPGEDDQPEDDAVNHPSHYNQNGPEVIELVRWLSFNRGNAVKYIARAGKKDPAKEEEDLEKAIWYLQDELKIVRGEVK